MLRKPFGVWFSVALVLLIAGFAVGWLFGERVDYFWYLHERHRLSTLPKVEQAQADWMITALGKVAEMRLRASPVAEPNLQDQARRGQIDALNHMRQIGELAEIKPILDLSVARAEVLLAEKSSDPQQAAQARETARALIQSLGWEDSSDDALRAIAAREANFWNPDFTRKVQK